MAAEKKPRVYAIIPARGGSKGVPHKNIIDLEGKPLIAWTIDQAKESELVEEVYVTTDDEKIANVSRQYGAKVIDRPEELARDGTQSEDALLHALDIIEHEQGTGIDAIVFLQATSPVREKNDIDNAVKKFFEDKADSLFSSTQFRDHFMWEEKDGKLVSVTYDYKKRKRRQDIKPKYLENGSIFVFKPELLRREHNRLGGKITTYTMEYWKSHQIDEMEDFEVCAYYIKKKLH